MLLIKRQKIDYIVNQHTFISIIWYIFSILVNLFFPLPLDPFIVSWHDTTAIILLTKIGIWGFSQKPRHLRNFPDTQALGKFPRYPGIWEILEISQIPIGI